MAPDEPTGRDVAWLQFLASALGSGGAGAVGLRLASAWLRRRQRRDAEETFKAIGEIVHALGVLRHSLGAARVALVVSWPRGSDERERRSSVLYESADDATPLLRHRWQSVRSTPDHDRVLDELERTGRAEVRVDELDSGSPLRVAYEADGICGSVERVVARGEERLYYVSVTRDSTEPATPHDEDLLRVTGARIAGELRRAPAVFGRVVDA